MQVFCSSPKCYEIAKIKWAGYIWLCAIHYHIAEELLILEQKGELAVYFPTLKVIEW
jgi:hypothetical protein